MRNLPQVQKGDDVVVTYYESIAITVRKPGEAKPGDRDRRGRQPGEAGEKPAAGVAQQTTVTATVVGLNKKKGTVTIKGPGGRTSDRHGAGADAARERQGRRSDRDRLHRGGRDLGREGKEITQL